MKKLLLVLSLIFVCTFAIAHTVEWYTDTSSLYDTTTCSIGDDITPPSAPTKYGYTFRGWSPYKILEYIESDGTQWIDTGQQFQSNIQIYLDTMYLSPMTGYGWGRNAGTQEVLWQTKTFYFGGGYSTIFERKLNVRYVYDLDFTDGAMVAKINGSVVRQTTNSYGNQPMANKIYLFAVNERDTVAPYSGRVYRFEIKTNSALIQYLILAKRVSDNVVGMYDTVSGKFFTNKGTGQFTAGPEVGN